MNISVKKSVYVLGFVLIMVGLAFNPSAFAHKVTIFAWVEGDKIFTESKLGGGKKARKAKILVYDAEGKQLLSGVTDDNGEFSFKIPKVETLKVELDAGVGHKAYWIVPKEELDPSLIVQAVAKPELEEKSEPFRSDSGCIDETKILNIVEERLDKKISPLVKKINASQHNSNLLKDILGGIGYILGLVGLGSYLTYRKKIKELST